MRSYSAKTLRFDLVKKALVRQDAPAHLAAASDSAIPRAVPYNGDASKAFYAVFEPGDEGTIISIPNALDDEGHRDAIREYVGKTFKVRQVSFMRRL
ncbi:MAG: hypothetical protein HY517_02620 [Candidatus Aenigmarchaeota archaeon]|nr:hypothetical protein [Candidatus Aenigmarchaeota archaeon]